MRRGVNALLVALAASTLAACGGSSKSSSSSGDASSPAAALKTYQTAIANGDGAVACSVLSPAIQKAAVAAAPRAGIKAADCASLFSQIAKHVPPTVRTQLRNTKVSSVVIHGDTATAKVQGVQGAPQANLSKIGGKWVISGGLNVGG